jgi:hypothetical protein
MLIIIYEKLQTLIKKRIHKIINTKSIGRLEKRKLNVKKSKYYWKLAQLATKIEIQINLNK